MLTSLFSTFIFQTVCFAVTKYAKPYYTWNSMNQQPVFAAPAAKVPLAMSNPGINNWWILKFLTSISLSKIGYVTGPDIFIGRPFVSSVCYFQWKCHGQRNWAINQIPWEWQGWLGSDGEYFLFCFWFSLICWTNWDENQNMLGKHFITKTENKCLHLELIIGDGAKWVGLLELRRCMLNTRNTN